MDFAGRGDFGVAFLRFGIPVLGGSVLEPCGVTITYCPQPSDVPHQENIEPESVMPLPK
jgi:hypothetical protein